MSQTNKNGTLITRMACAIFFLLFTFLYLYEYQSDVLAVAQHVLSHGATHYNRTVGAVLITVALWLIQIGIYAISGLSRKCHALTYLPSMLLLGIITDVSPSFATGCYPYFWLWVFPLLMVFYAYVVWVARQLEPMEMPVTSTGILSMMSWLNILQMLVMALIVCGIGNSNEILHYRLRTETLLQEGNYAKAAMIGDDDMKTDSSLTCLRIWALSEEGKLGEKLFDYPLVGKSDAMLPNGKSVKIMMAPEESLYKNIGVVFKQKVRPRRYLELVHERHFATRHAHDYLLCAYLLDCDIDAFAKALPHYYNIKGELPKNYREALVLYNHVRNRPLIVYHSNVMDADYDDFEKLSKDNTKSREERLSNLKDSYGNTYWFYYLAQSKR